MKFKQQEEEPEVQKTNKDELYTKLSDLIQLEFDKLALLKSAKYYFFDKGLINNEKFFAKLYNACLKNKDCILDFTMDKFHDLPDVKSSNVTFFKEDREPFTAIAEKEDNYVDLLNELITIACTNHNWEAFNYLLKKLDEVKWICNKALATFDNKGNVLDLCEQLSKEK